MHSQRVLRQRLELKECAFEDDPCWHVEGSRRDQLQGLHIKKFGNTLGKKS